MKPLTSTIVSLFLLIGILTACGTRATGPFFEKLESKEQANAIIYLFAQGQIGPIFTQRAYPIKANGVPVVKLVDGGYYPFRVAPGVVTFEVETFGGVSIPLRLHVEGGQTYFVRPIYWGGYGAKTELTLLSEVEAIHLIAPCRLIVEPPALESP